MTQLFHVCTLELPPRKWRTIRDRFKKHFQDSIRVLLNSRAQDYPGKQRDAFGMPFFSSTHCSLFQYENWHRLPFFRAYFHERQMLRRYWITRSLLFFALPFFRAWLERFLFTNASPLSCFCEIEDCRKLPFTIFNIMWKIMSRNQKSKSQSMEISNTINLISAKLNIHQE